MKPFEIRVPTETVDSQFEALKPAERRWCGNDCDILGYDKKHEAEVALMIATMAAQEPRECYAVRGLD